MGIFLEIIFVRDYIVAIEITNLQFGHNLCVEPLLKILFVYSLFQTYVQKRCCAVDCS